MEVLGAAASVAGLISLALEVPKIIDTVISIQAAPEESRELSKTASALVETLKKLETFLKTEEARDMEVADDSALLVSISVCQKRILDLSRKFRSQSDPTPNKPASKRIKTAISRFRWPFDKKECLELISELHAMESTFQFCLVMKNW